MKARPPSTRGTAVRLVHAVVHDGKSLAQLGPPAWAEIADERDRAFVQACVYGVLRSLFSLRARLAGLLDRPLRRKEAEIETLLLLGLYQLGHMRIPPHAAVSATVECARELNKAWACAFVNGVLRRALRAPPDTAARADAAVEFEHPHWMVERFRRDWPQDWQSILRNGNRQAPLTLRVNRRRTSVEDYQALLGAHGLETERTRYAPAGLLLRETTAVAALPNFALGWVSVQDEAAQLAAELLAPEPGERILDACAAPGGKTTHLLERAGPGAQVLALDQAAARMAGLTHNLARLGLDCRTATGDAGTPQNWWDGERFDRILLDVPCSALGVIRRHPDIRLRRQPEDIERLAQEQQRLLLALWPLLRPGGRLLYATCSILPAENDDIITVLLTHCADARAITLDVPWGRATRHGRQILPGEDDMDGFYYAQLTKQQPA